MIHIVKDLVLGCRSECGHGYVSNIQQSTIKEANDSLARFLKDYALLFPGYRLQGATYSSPDYQSDKRHYGIFNPPNRYHVDTAILRALPPPKRLRVISPDKWSWIATHLHRTDMSLVRSIDWLPMFPDDPSLLVKVKGFKPQRLLRWCQALERLYKGCFGWAVEEKNDLERLEHGAMGSRVHCVNSNNNDSDPGDEQDDESFHPDYFTTVWCHSRRFTSRIVACHHRISMRSFTHSVDRWSHS